MRQMYRWNCSRLVASTGRVRRAARRRHRAAGNKHSIVPAPRGNCRDAPAFGFGGTRSAPGRAPRRARVDHASKRGRARLQASDFPAGNGPLQRWRPRRAGCVHWRLRHRHPYRPRPRPGVRPESCPPPAIAGRNSHMTLSSHRAATGRVVISGSTRSIWRGRFFKITTFRAKCAGTTLRWSATILAFHRDELLTETMPVRRRPAERPSQPPARPLSLSATVDDAPAAAAGHQFLSDRKRRQALRHQHPAAPPRPCRAKRNACSHCRPRKPRPQQAGAGCSARTKVRLRAAGAPVSAPALRTRAERRESFLPTHHLHGDFPEVAIGGHQPP